MLEKEDDAVGAGSTGHARSGRFAARAVGRPSLVRELLPAKYELLAASPRL